MGGVTDAPIRLMVGPEPANQRTPWGPVVRLVILGLLPVWMTVPEDEIRPNR